MAKSKAAAILALALVSGCMNLTVRPREDHNQGPYFCTIQVADGVATAFRAPRGPEGPIEKAVAILMLPITVVDTPLEAVCDTVLLPWDLFQTWRSR